MANSNEKPKFYSNLLHDIKQTSKSVQDLKQYVPNEKTKTYSKLINDDFNSLNLKNNSYYNTSYILRCVEGPYEGKQVKLHENLEDFVIGSSDNCNLTIDDEYLAPKHCKISRVPNTIYFTLESFPSEIGTWKKLSFFDEPLEIIETTHFKIFQNHFSLEITPITLNKDLVLKYKYVSKTISDDECVEIGKKDCMVELNLNCVENHVLKIQKVNGRTFISYTTPDITNDGFFYKVNAKQKVILRAEDCFKIGDNMFRLMSHNYGLFNEIGDKFHQEDCVTIIDDLKLFENVAIPFYAIYDGHGGMNCSTYIKTHFHKNLRFLCKNKNLKDSEPNFFIEFCKIIQEAIVFTDINFVEKETTNGLNQGSSCLCLFFIGNKIISCNLGDSLAILVKGGGKEIYLNRKHEASWDKERERIQMKNGIVNGGIIFGALSVSRSFGDWKLKDPAKADFIKKMFVVEIDEYLIDNRADFRLYEIESGQDEYIILTTSGLIELIGKRKILEYVSKFYSEEKVQSGLTNMQLIIDKVRLEIINDLYADEKNKNIENLTLLVLNLFN